MAPQLERKPASSGSFAYSIPIEHIRQNIPIKKQFVDPYRHGLIIEGGVGYGQIITSYKVEIDKTATLESILNLLQIYSTPLSRSFTMSGLLGNGFGATHGMVRNNLIWVVSRVHVQVDHYPIWGEIVEMDIWVGASSKNGMRRDWLVRSQATGHVFARATRSGNCKIVPNIHHHNLQFRTLANISAKTNLNMAYYKMSNIDGRVTNPEQQIAIDVPRFSSELSKLM
ncbi:hypothetical protein K2173_002373 [Erythroxylum novogranatense]|uniref:Acyl-[acyl-carrier-protein] hydrolase n=1 Tax=Erythroxylum novogranatense TaxID=1862640 RepID=A0AAV8TB47_9ROSI|nr:hypothetical protein K2173_002373 [Erythroxylum novogranatense]